MQLQAWRTVLTNPCDEPPGFITIAPSEQLTGIWPWVITLDRAIEIFGEETVKKIGEEPAPVTLTLSLLP